MTIAFVNSTGVFSTGGTTSITVSFDVGSGSSRCLIVAVEGEVAENLINGASYNGVAMTLLSTNSQSNYYQWLFGLIGPASGANNIVANASAAATAIKVHAACYTGVNRFGAATTAFSTASSLATSFVNPVSGSWGVLFANANVGLSSGTNATPRTNNGFNSAIVFDTAGPLSGNFTMSVESGSTGLFKSVGVVMADLPLTSAGGQAHLTLLGAM
jgi:hypothetical protein